MKHKLHLIMLGSFLSLGAQAQFNLSAQNWTIPAMQSSAYDLDQVGNANYSMIDVNGDGFVDLIDPQDNSTSNVWLNGNSPYWKIYLGNGSSFSLTAQNWNIPAMENYANLLNSVNSANYFLVDMNGDGKPDLVDPQDNSSTVVWLNGNSPYWKVYLNTGTSFNLTAQNWPIPIVENTAAALDVISNGNFSLMDINGDRIPDLVDAQDNNSGAVWLNGNTPYWKVYLNSGTAFNMTAQNWNVPIVEQYAQDLDVVGNGYFSLVDVNGDAKPDMVDARDNASGAVWLQNGNTPYWKVYLNSGTAFNLTAQNWTVPAVQSSAMDLNRVNNTNYGLIDINGDGILDMVDAQDNSTNAVWLQNGNTPYWKVYKGTGTSFNLTAVNWIVPAVQSSAQDLDMISNGNYAVVDMTGDGKPEMVDAQDNSTNAVWLQNGNSPYWKVYTNTSTDPYLSIEEQQAAVDLNVYPNPTNGLITINLSDLESESRITIANSAGIVIHDALVSDHANFNFDLSDYTSGLYFISVSNNNRVFNAKVIKQ